VSPSEFDGTPNTLLEAMACGAFPVAGDIASVREWIDDGANGLLVDPGDPRALADAILRAIGDGGLRERAAARNRALVAERADHVRVMARAEALYARVAAAAGEIGRPPAAVPRTPGAAAEALPGPHPLSR
jgi:glycosyltransferase involved in cell wall biosynthesis